MSGDDLRLGPDDLLGRSFTIGLRGYDQDEVTSFLERAAEAWRASLSAGPGAGLSASAIAALTGAGEEPPSAPTASDPSDLPDRSSPSNDGAPTLRLLDEPPAGPVASTTDGEGPAPEPRPSDDPLHARWRAEAERDRATAFAERTAAELDRAGARTELAQAHERALEIIDQSQRRADAVLTNAVERAQAEASSVLEDARTRLMPLLETERAVRARIARLRLELDEVSDETIDLVLPDARQLVTDAEDDPEAPEVSFPVGFGLVSVGAGRGAP